MAPRTVENFRSLCVCDGGIGQISNVPLCYKGTRFHRVSKWLECVLLYYYVVCVCVVVDDDDERLDELYLLSSLDFL